jgi:hypothetical protein
MEFLLLIGTLICNSKEENIVLPNAPDINGEFHSIAMHTFDVGLQNMNRRSYFQKSGILEGLAHHFHMMEVWTKSQTFYQDFGIPVSAMSFVDVLWIQKKMEFSMNWKVFSTTFNIASGVLIFLITLPIVVLMLLNAPRDLT